MATGAFHDIDLPAPQARTRATLLSVARRIPPSELVREGANRFLAGVEWLPWPTIDHTGQAVDCDETFDKLPRTLRGLTNQPAFVLWDSLKCGAGGQNLNLLADALRLSFTDFLSASFAAELETAAASDGLGLVGDATDTPTIVTASAVGLDVAIAELEEYLAVDSGQPGIRGVIHLTPGLLVLADAADLIRWTGDHYETATGHLVIGDAGHTGQAAPFGGSAAAAGQAWIYATGDIWYAQSAIEGVLEIEGPDGGAYYQPRNENRPLAEIYGLIVFDPNVLAAALVTVGLPGGSSGGGGGGDASAANQTTGNALLSDIETAVDGLEAQIAALTTALGDVDTNLESIEALTAHRPLDRQLTSSGLTTAATTYAVGDALGAIFEVTNAAAAAGGSCVITGLSILDEGDVLAGVDVYIWKASISQTDNAAFAPSDSDARNLLHKVRLPIMDDLGSNRFISIDGLYLPCYCTATSLFITLVTLSANAVFTAASDIKLNVFGHQLRAS